jgi:hypothetical protein
MFLFVVATKRTFKINSRSLLLQYRHMSDADGISALADFLEDMGDDESVPEDMPIAALADVLQPPTGIPDDTGTAGLAPGLVEGPELNEPLLTTGARHRLSTKHGGKGNSPHTQRKIKPVLNWWNAFRQSKGLPADDSPSVMNPETGDVDNNLTVEFVNFLDQLNPPPSYKQLENAILFMQFHYNAERKSRGLPVLMGAVKQDDVVKATLTAYARKRAYQFREDGTDIQADLQNEISPCEMLQLVTSAFNPSHPALRQMEPLTRLQFCVALRQTFTTGQRGVDIRNQYYNFYTTYPCKYIGPVPSVMNVIVSNQSKVNKVGRIEYTGFVTHVNPALDLSGLMGLLLMYRHCCTDHGGLGEPFPNMCDHQELNSRPGYRQVRSYLNPWDARTMLNVFTSFINAHGVVADKKTHQGRRQAQQEMISSGVCPESVTRMCGYSTTASKPQTESTSKTQNLSYLTNPPVDAVVQRAGSDPKYPRCHLPLWSTPSVSQELLDIAAAYLSPQRKIVDERIDQLRTAASTAAKPKSTHAALKSNQMITANGTLSAFEHDVCLALLQAAARPLDEQNRLVPDSEPLYKTWGQFPLFRKHPVFQSAPFLELVEKVKEAQESDHGDEAGEAGFEVPASGGAWERAIASLVTQPISQLSRQQQLQGAQIGRLETNQNLFFAEMRRLWQTRGSETGTVTGTVVEELHNPEPAAQARLSQGSSNHESIQNAEEQDLCRNGNARKKRRALKRADVATEQQSLMRSDNITIEDFWNEWYHGSADKEPLYKKEELGPEWRTNPKPSDPNEKPRHSLSTYFNYRCPMFNLIWHYWKNEGPDVTEQQAIAKAKLIFQQAPVSRNGIPDLKKLAPLMTAELKRLGGYNSKKWGGVSTKRKFREDGS